MADTAVRVQLGHLSAFPADQTLNGVIGQAGVGSIGDSTAAGRMFAALIRRKPDSSQQILQV